MNFAVWPRALLLPLLYVATINQVCAATAPLAGSAGALRLPADLALDLVLREPVVAQPVFLNFDERGRMWVVQYLQYPHPAGLTAVAHDEFWRVVYDRVKPPPPYDTADKAAFRGRDRITIHEDVRGDGSFAKATTFVDGLNIATSVARGRGGVWVLTPPHLVFYADANNDDIPDGPPVVHLEGFGFEDTHSMANSLRWGPDGWLYGAQGSTVTAAIKRPGLDGAPIAHIIGQCIWRYHPESRRFEVFAEGGGNTFYVEIDAKGRLFSGHNGGNTRGFYYPQGGYLLKGFEKHGELSNPYAFGYFPAMAHAPIKRFTHGFLIYQGHSLPESYRGKVIGADAYNHTVTLSEISPQGATFQTRDLAPLISTDDVAFRPVDLKHGPDGAIYVADWRDRQLTHKESTISRVAVDDGRIYRVRAAGVKPGGAPFDLTRKTSPELIELLRHENRWWRDEARRLLGDRRDAQVVPALRSALREASGQFALEALWALNLSGGFDELTAGELLEHADPFVRLWSVRLLGDEGTISTATAAALVAMAEREPHVEVRSQLAASAKRFSAAVGLPLVGRLLRHDADAADPYLPLELWWAMESKCTSDRAAVVALLQRDDWARPLVRQHLAARLMRRLAAAGSADDLLACAELLKRAPDAASRLPLMEGFEQAFAGRVLPPLPSELVTAMVNAGGASRSLRLRQRDPAAIAEALRALSDEQVPLVERLRLLAVLGEVPVAGAAAFLGQLLHASNEKIRRGALAAAMAYADEALSREIVGVYPRLSFSEKEMAQAVLVTRASSASLFLNGVEAGVIKFAEVSVETPKKLRLLAKGVFRSRVDRLFGQEVVPAPAHLQDEIARILSVLMGGSGDPYRGRIIYEATCAACHRLHGKGGEIGPDLTSFKRDDLAVIVRSVVNPSAEIREGYELFMAETKLGAVYSGFLVSQDAERVALRDMTGVNTVVPRAQLASLQGVGRSVMPEGLLAGLAEDSLRDLFTYLRTTQPLVIKNKK